MRGALAGLPGIEVIDITVGEQVFSVTYDPKLVDPARMLEALAAKEEGAKLNS